jgi:L-ascorbate metabolism protein UlaG (beta-lactamase superfamily)
MIRMTRRALLVFVLVLACVCTAGAARLAPENPGGSVIFEVPGVAPAPRTEHGFKNADPAYSRASYVERVRSLILGGQWLVAPRQAPLEAVSPDVQALRANGHDATVTWIGHSTLLVQLDGATFLTDPVWSKRTGPFGGLIGVGRVTPPPVKLEDLPPIDFVLISHDHYDHLDEATVRQLAHVFNPVFVVPLGIKAWLAGRGITNAVELDWGQAVKLKGLTIVCAPAQHGSGRSLLDQGRRLWASWAVLGSQRFYFAGDTGYYSHFKEIGEALGPFDLAALPIGSYTPAAIAHPVHLSPEEALKAWTDLRAARFIGIHWGTFRLAREPYDEPPARIAAEVERRGLDPHSVWIPTPGQTLPW